MGVPHVMIIKTLEAVLSCFQMVDGTCRWHYVQGTNNPVKFELHHLMRHAQLPQLSRVPHTTLTI